MGKIRKTDILTKLSKTYRYKWENHDINNVGQANIPKFRDSTFHYIGTPLRLFESIFVDVLVNMIIGYTKLYGHREKADTRFESF